MRGIVAIVAWMLSACGGSAQNASSPCGAEPGDDDGSGCLASDAPDVGVLRFGIARPYPSVGFVDAHGESGRLAAGDALDLEIVLGTDTFTTEPTTLDLVSSDTFEAGITALVLTRRTCVSVAPSPFEHTSPSCPHGDEIEDDFELARVTGGVLTCDATDARIACRFDGVPFVSREGAPYRASGWLHVPR